MYEAFLIHNLFLTSNFSFGSASDIKETKLEVLIWTILIIIFKSLTIRGAFEKMNAKETIVCSKLCSKSVYNWEV